MFTFMDWVALLAYWRGRYSSSYTAIKVLHGWSQWPQNDQIVKFYATFWSSIFPGKSFSKLKLDILSSFVHEWMNNFDTRERKKQKNGNWKQREGKK